MKVGLALLRIDLCFPELCKGARTWSSQGGVEDEDQMGLGQNTKRRIFLLNTSIYHQFFTRMPVFGLIQLLPGFNSSLPAFVDPGVPELLGTWKSLQGSVRREPATRVVDILLRYVEITRPENPVSPTM